MITARFPRRRAAATQIWSMVWLTVVWVLLWGDLSVANVLAGFLLGFVVTVGLPMPRIDYHGTVRPMRVLRLVGRFIIDLVKSSFQIALLALSRRTTQRPAVIAVQLRSSNEFYMTLTADLCSLVPGSLVVELHRLTGRMYLHLIDVGAAGGLERARERVYNQEARVLWALASRPELIRAGLLPAPGGTS